nr:YjaG family protein [uncultured Glaciecola sp.]
MSNANTKQKSKGDFTGDKLSTFQQVRDLSKKPAVAFSAALLQRMLPNYQLFCDVSEFGDKELATKLVELIWEWLNASKAKINIAVQLEKLEEVTPDIENFDNFGVYPALDFCMALTATLQLMADEEPGGAVIVAKLSQGGVEAYLLALSETDLSNEEIKQDPLMQFEIDTQLEVLAMCKDKSIDFKSLRREMLAQEMSNIGLSLGD